MNNSKEALCALLRTTQMAKIDLESALTYSMPMNLRSALRDQLREYDAIELEAHSIASQRGWELAEVDPAVRFLADRMTRLKLTGRTSHSRIADILIRKNTNGMITGVRALHQLTGEDQRVRILSQRLLDCVRANIRQMQHFL